MSEGDFFNVLEGGTIPLVKLNQNIEQNLHRSNLNDNGKRIISGTVDSLLKNAVTPDHLLIGLENGIDLAIDGCFVQVDNGSY